MNAELITEELVSHLTKRYGKPERVEKARIQRFGSALTCPSTIRSCSADISISLAFPRPSWTPNTLFQRQSSVTSFS